MKPVAALAACCLSLGLSLTLTGCGSEGGTAGDPTPTTSLPTGSLPTTPSVTIPTVKPIVLPACGKVWVGDAKLPGSYKGCKVAGSNVPADVVHCESGQKIVTYDNRFYAVPGAVINDVGDLASSDQYHRAMNSCLG